MIDRVLGESDWEDDDLLTVDEASHRLAEEIRLQQERVAELQSSAGDGAAPTAELSAARDRLARLTEAKRRIDDGVPRWR